MKKVVIDWEDCKENIRVNDEDVQVYYTPNYVDNLKERHIGQGLIELFHTAIIVANIVLILYITL